MLLFDALSFPAGKVPSMSLWKASIDVIMIMKVYDKDYVFLSQKKLGPPTQCVQLCSLFSVVF